MGERAPYAYFLTFAFFFSFSFLSLSLKNGTSGTNKSKPSSFLNLRCPIGCGTGWGDWGTTFASTGPRQPFYTPQNVSLSGSPPTMPGATAPREPARRLPEPFCSHCGPS